MTAKMVALDSRRGRDLGFTRERFHEGSYLFEADDAVYISFVWSKERGHFRALCEAILGLGKAVKVPTPLAEMLAIVQRAGYRHTVEHDFVMGEVEVWVKEPSRG